MLVRMLCISSNFNGSEGTISKECFGYCLRFVYVTVKVVFNSIPNWFCCFCYAVRSYINMQLSSGPTHGPAKWLRADPWTCVYFVGH